MMTMRTIACAALLTASACACAQATRSAAASQTWVENYVSNAIASLRAPTLAKTVNGTTSMALEGGTLTIYKPTDAALKVVNSVSSVTNGTLFVWNGENIYRSQSESIEATKTNLLYRGVHSTETKNTIHFDGFFDVVGVLVSAPTSLAITNNVETAK